MNERERESDLAALKAEHDSVRRHLEHARQIADSVGEVSVDELKGWLDHAVHTIGHQFLPHARHEESSLYARFPEARGTPSAAEIFRRDHAEFALLVDELREARTKVGDPLTSELARDLRRILYSMYAILKLHFAVEEALYADAAEQKTHRLRNTQDW